MTIHRQLSTIVIAFVALSAAANIGRAQQPNRHAFFEGFRSAGFGYDMREVYAFEQLDEKFPGRAIIVAYHTSVPDNHYHFVDAMENLQADSIVQSIGYPASQVINAWPNGRANRTTYNGSWNMDPSRWADSAEIKFGISTIETVGLVNEIVAQTPKVSCGVTNVHFDDATGTITADVTSHFNTAMSGDLRMNLLITEDSVSGAPGTGYDQANFFSKKCTWRDDSKNLPNNPYYDYDEVLTSFKFNHVFREAVAGVRGRAGVIPASVEANANYTTTFSFTLPGTVSKSNPIHLIGLVHEYSRTDTAKNQVFDAMEVPLIIPVSLAVHASAPQRGELTASPNPFRGVTTVQCSRSLGERMTALSVCDLLGREIAQLPVTRFDGGYSAQFDATTLAAGTYIVVAHTTTGVQAVRVVNK